MSVLKVKMNTEDLKQNELNELILMLEKDKEKYEKAYNILIEYFDSIADEEKPKVHKQLKKLGL